MRDRLVPVAIALLCIVAVGIGAASLSQPADSNGGNGFFGDGDTAETNSTTGDSPPRSEAQSGQQQAAQGDTQCISGWDSTSLGVILLATVLALSALVGIHEGSVMAGIVVLPVLAIPAVLLMTGLFGFIGCAQPGQQATAAVQENGTVVQNGTSFNNAFGSGEGEGSLTSRLQIVGTFLVIVTVLLAGAFYVQRRDSDEVADDHPTQVSDIAAAAGEAADEIEHVSADTNGIYRAWAKMTEVLDVDHPETSTPQEFADAALAAGLNADDVQELTELFETTRYGTTSITSDHEKRAEDALRRIEREHAGPEESPDEDQEGEKWR
ncbi:DUF4129 domain-containing protein [Halovenus rubra]|uniref:DUF4129 domain-containing protein n=2 Tax=Halovenus rubra TaxID=869890 RepID=A0ACC7DYW7_9EURY|nr:DUF4129 domain-containing protein [Halovenus rubra]